MIGALDVNAFFKQSKLKDVTLKEIWDLADPTGKGYLDRMAFYISLKYVALAQSGQQIKVENLVIAAPPPKLVKMNFRFYLGSMSQLRAILPFTLKFDS